MIAAVGFVLMMNLVWGWVVVLPLFILLFAIGIIFFIVNAFMRV